MKITYTLTLEDVVAFNLEYIKTLSESVKTIKRNRLILPIVYGVIGVVVFLLQPEHFFLASFVLVLALLWYFFYPQVWERKTARALKKHLKKREDLRLGGKHELEIKDKYIEAKSESRNGKVPWKEVRRIIVNKYYIYLFLTDRDAIIVPRERIEEAVVWEDFCKQVQVRSE